MTTDQAYVLLDAYNVYLKLSEIQHIRNLPQLADNFLHDYVGTFESPQTASKQLHTTTVGFEDDGYDVIYTGFSDNSVHVFSLIG